MKKRSRINRPGEAYRGKSTRASGNLGPPKPRAAKSGGKKGGKGRDAPVTAKGIKLRVIAGDMRGRPIAYHGASFTRPMKDHVRENLFNVLGKSLRGTIALDLFAGTGALAIESISRGSIAAKAIERDRVAADYIRKNGVTLGIEEKLLVVEGDTFRLGHTLMAAPNPESPNGDTPWAVYLCPPYEMWESRKEDLFGLIRTAITNAPPGSRIVIETERGFDCDSLPGDDWDIRPYGNVVLGFHSPAMVCGMTF